MRNEKTDTYHSGAAAMSRRKRKLRGTSHPDAPRPEPPSVAANRRWPILLLAGLGAIAVIVYQFWPVTPPSIPPDGSPTAAADGPRRSEQQDQRLKQTAALADLAIDRGPTWQQIDDPRKDGWDTEVFSQQADRQLKKLAKLVMSDARVVDQQSVAELVASDFACGALRPEPLDEVYRDQMLVVRRGPKHTELSQPSRPYRAAAGLTTSLRSLLEPFAAGADVRLAFKMFNVQRSANLMTTRQYVELSGPTTNGRMQETSTWTCGWAQRTGDTDSGGTASEDTASVSTASEDTAPELLWIDVEDFEQVTKRGGQEALFADCTQSALAQNESYAAQLLYGLDYWSERTQDQAPDTGAPGIAVGDVNGDGLDDIYLCQESGLPNRLYVQQPDGTVKDVSQNSKTDWLDSCRAALIVDLNNDSRQDLAVATVGNLILAAGDGRGRFTIRSVVPVSADTRSLSAADYDNDGRLDLYVCAYESDSKPPGSGSNGLIADAEGLVYHDANTGGRNALLHNETITGGEWRFTDVTDRLGLDQNNRRFSFAAGWEDFDNDGDQDLYVANDFGRNTLFRNERTDDGNRMFVDIAAIADAEDSAAGMSVAWGDYNRDGNMDLYVGNMFSAAGSRITNQPGFKPRADQGVRARLRRFTRGNTLLENTGNPTEPKFRDVSEVAAVTMGRWAWSSVFVDVNNDGWQDLVVANGMVTTSDTGDL